MGYSTIYIFFVPPPFKGFTKYIPLYDISYSLKTFFCVWSILIYIFLTFLKKRTAKNKKKYTCVEGLTFHCVTKQNCDIYFNSNSHQHGLFLVCKEKKPSYVRNDLMC